MPVFSKDDLRVLFVHVPKAGGSAIERAFADAEWRVAYRDARVRAGGLNDLRRCSPQHMHASMLETILVPERFDAVFMTVREPLARFRSEYAMRNAQAGAPAAAAVERWYDEAVRAYAANPFVHDNHLRPQAEFVLPNAQVYRLEEGLENVVADLNERFGLRLPPTVPRVMDRHIQNGIHSRDVPISERLERRLRIAYAEDFMRFGYSA